MLKKILIVSSAALLTSCNGNKSETENTSATDTVKNEVVSMPENAQADFKFRTLVLNIPSPFEVITLLPNTGVNFNKDLINPVEKESKYVTSGQKALNYGCYISDLVYLASNEQFSQVKSYFTTSRNLAQSIDCVEMFDKISGTRLDAYVDKKDTINKVVDDLMVLMDNYLRSNDRLLTATEILVGSWVESQYLATSSVKDQDRDEKNEAVYNNISLQGFAVESLIGLLKEFESEKEIKPLLQDMRDLDKMYKDAIGTPKGKDFVAAVNKKLISAREKIVK